MAKVYEDIGSDLKEVYSDIMDDSAVTKAPYVFLDITDKDKVLDTLKTIKPNCIVYCAAWTAVDASDDEDKKDLVYKVNVDGTKDIAFAKGLDAKMIYIITDYVFDGEGDKSWLPDDKCYAPQNVYGQTKLDGELAVSSLLSKYYIVKIAWVLGLNGNNFIKTMINVGKKHDTVRVVISLGMTLLKKSINKLIWILKYY